MEFISKAKHNKTDRPTSNDFSSVYDIKLQSLDGQPMDLSQYKGKKILIVNVASKCGFTSQYEGLEKLASTYSDNLVVIGCPCNQFGAQEPGSAAEIQEFCSVRYGVGFPMTEKLAVKGSDQHPLYQWLTSKRLNGKKNSSVKWNFQKYLLDEEGHLIDYYYSITKPMSSKITKHVA
ncbi:MAG: glutathione peroxidase [Dokdonia sp.]|jgi:glutathione peroxidase|nr:glutathione peroxidase [Cytophagaceae bacterium]